MSLRSIRATRFNDCSAQITVARRIPAEAPLMARQQFVAHPLRIHSGPPFAAVRECANSLIADEPCYLRDRKVGLTEIVRGEIGAELIENFTKAQAFRSQPPRQRPGAHAKRLRNSVEPRLAMRQQWSDRIFDSDSQDALAPARNPAAGSR